MVLLARQPPPAARGRARHRLHGAHRDVAGGVPRAVRGRPSRASAWARPPPPTCGRAWPRSAYTRRAPDARIIAIIREPASFLRSLHLQLLQNRHEAVFDFRKAVELDDARRESRHIPRRGYWPAALIYSDRVRYVEQLRRYHELFGREQVLVLIYDDFRSDNLATVRGVLRFLGVSDEFELQAIEANPSVAPRSAALETLRQGLKSGQAPLWRALRGTGKTLTTLAVRERFLYPYLPRALYREPPPPDEKFMAELRRRFKPEVVALSEYLQRDLVALWGYDGIG